MKNLIFDFDGVLGDTYHTWTTVQQTMNTLANGEKEHFVDLDTYSARKPVHSRNHTLTEAEMVTLQERITNGGRMVLEMGVRLFDDFIAEIKSLDNARKAVVSSGSQVYVLPALAKTEIDFTHILAYEDHHSKEEKIEIVCRDWGVSIHDVYYFTDTLADVYELKELIHKDKLIGVSWGYCSKEQLLSELPPENILDLPQDLTKIIAV